MDSVKLVAKLNEGAPELPQKIAVLGINGRGTALSAHTAHLLTAPHYIITASPIGARGYGDVTIGALIGDDDTLILDQDVIVQHQIPKDAVLASVQVAKFEAVKSFGKLSSAKLPLKEHIQGRHVLLVTDHIGANSLLDAVAESMRCRGALGITPLLVTAPPEVLRRFPQTVYLHSDGFLTNAPGEPA